MTEQLSRLAAPGKEGAFQSRLSCFGLDFTPLRLGNGATLGPDSQLKELVRQAQPAALDERAADQAEPAGLLARLNGSDPLGSCGARP